MSFIPQNLKGRKVFQITVGGGREIKREASLPRQLCKCSVSTCYVQKPDLGGGQAPPLSRAGDLCGWGGHYDNLACALLLRQRLSLIRFCKLVKSVPGILLPTPMLPGGLPYVVVRVRSCDSQPGSSHFVSLPEVIIPSSSSH